MIWKIWKKASRKVIRYGQYRRNLSRIVKKIGKIWKKDKLNPFFHILHIISQFNLLFFHIFNIFSQFPSVFSKSFHYSTSLSRKASWIVKRFGKYRRKLWNDIENMEERQVEYRRNTIWILHIFHIFSQFSSLFFQIISLFDLPFFHIFFYHFTIRPTFLPHFPYLFTIQLTFLLYFLYLFSIQIVFLRYSTCLSSIERQVE
jgi:rRNA maturation protein Nop10